MNQLLLVDIPIVVFVPISMGSEKAFVTEPSPIAIFAPVPLPADLDPDAAVTVHLQMGKDANANAFAVAVNAFFGVGDANCGGNTANVAQALAEYAVTLAAADVPAQPSFLTIALIPAAHAGDALYLYSAHLSYTRKV